jgi:ferredoxin
MTHVVAEPCIGCKHTDCAIVCPTECFFEGPRMVYIEPDECIDCESCVPECPEGAIYLDDNLPDEWIPFRDLNATMARQTAVVRRIARATCNPFGDGTRRPRAQDAAE